MASFSFTIKDASGLSPKKAGELVKKALECSSRITLRKGEKTGDAKLIFHVLSLAVKPGDELEVLVEGEDAQSDADKLLTFMKENL